METDNIPTIHQGRNIKRFREMLGMKQEILAMELGNDWTQKKISLLEQKETIDDALLEQVAKALKIPAEAIKSFDEETAIVNIQNNYQGSNSSSGTIANGSSFSYDSCTFNPFDKVVELYEALLKSEREKIALLERMLEKK